VFQKMTSARMHQERLQKYLQAVFPDPRRTNDESRYERALSQVRTDRAGAEMCYDIGMGNREKGVAGTLWAAYNGVAEYIDYRKYAKATIDRQVEAVWFGDGYGTKARAYTIAEKNLSAWLN
jgi:hypothetical protein